MKPISIQIVGETQQSPEEICAAFLDTRRWAEFEGYLLLPGIQSAQFEVRTPTLVGSRIRVHDRDGSSHVEEIIAWDDRRGFSLRFGDFQPPLARLATHFTETWQLRPSAKATMITRSMELHPTGPFSRLMLLPIAWMMKKSFEKQQRHFNRPLS